MIDIQRTLNVNFAVLQHIIGDVLPLQAGVSSNNSNDTRIHLPDTATVAQQSQAQNLLDNYSNLPVSASTNSLTEGDPDPTITCDDSSITGDTQLGYIVLLDGQSYADGTTPVTSGTAELILVAPIAGTYDIYLFRQAGDYASGSIQIIVSEA